MHPWITINRDIHHFRIAAAPRPKKISPRTTLKRVAGIFLASFFFISSAIAHLLLTWPAFPSAVDPSPLRRIFTDILFDNAGQFLDIDQHGILRVPAFF